MNLSQLYYFKKLAELQHYTRAAKELYIAQPTLSDAISSLEKELGVALFCRDGRSVKLTSNGSEFYRYVSDSLRSLDDGIDAMNRRKTQLGGTVSLGATFTVQDDYLPTLLKAYREHVGDEVRIETYQAFTNYLTQSLHNETLRVKVTNLPAGKTVKWSSEDEKVAIVDEDGLVTAKGPGVTTITADVGGKTAELIVRCSFEDTAEGGYHLSLTDVTLSVGESFNLRLLDENDERVEGASYSVKDTTVCTADGSKITGKASGVTRVTVTYYGESFECIIRVK